MILAAALMVLPALAQTFGANPTEQPNAAFQSTSTMTGSGSSYSANPTLNADGTATYENATPSNMSTGSGPRRTRPTDHGNQPIGDAVLPLLLMAFAFGMFVYFRRKRSALSR